MRTWSPGLAAAGMLLIAHLAAAGTAQLSGSGTIALAQPHLCRRHLCGLLPDAARE